MKHSFKNLVTVILLMTVISCTKEPLKSPAAVSTQTQDNATQKTAGHYIGERFGGGVIFYLSKDHLRGLIADTVDLPPAPWWYGPDITTGATGQAIGTGPSNTRKIILAQGTTGIYAFYAALECANSTRSGYTDWFLPSMGELNRLYKQKKVVGGFENNCYWSSSDYSFTIALYQNFYDGNQNISFKVITNSVRAVRAF